MANVTFEVPEKKERERPVIISGPGRTKQSFKDKVDINKIVAKHKRTGMITHLSAKSPFYGDVSSLTDYQSCLNVVNEAEDLFGKMSAKVREKFKNNPMNMIQFLENPDNLEEAIELGMVIKKEEDEPVPNPEPPAEPSNPNA